MAYPQRHDVVSNILLCKGNAMMAVIIALSVLGKSSMVCNAFTALQRTSSSISSCDWKFCAPTATPRHHQPSSLYMILSNNPSPPPLSHTTTPSRAQASLQQHQSYDRPMAQQMVSKTLCPPNEERDRNIAGMEAYDNDGSSNNEAITSDDPRTEYTYAEFPLDSFDLLVDRALDFLVHQKEEEEDDRMIEVGNQDTAAESRSHNQHRTMVDLGSGCGRLVFYAALTRGGGGGKVGSYWNVHGVEIGTQLHSLAVNSLQRGTEQGWFVPSTNDKNSSLADESSSSSQITFHNGNALLVEDPYYTSPEETDSHSAAASIQSLLSTTNLLFAYSTVFETNAIQQFNPELQAMILSPKWSRTLASLCPNGCVAITTDRALNPEDGWRLLDRMDVDNPSVWGSVGYISVLEK